MNLPRPVLETSGLVKSFQGVRALDGVDFDLLPREVHAVLGENGAGKSTLMNLLYGLLRPDTGKMTLWGRPYHPSSPREASVLGVGMVHQHFMLIPDLSVAENISLGVESGNALILDLKTTARHIRELSEKYGLPVDPWARVADLGVGMRQRVEIIKAFYRHAKLLILDEPTALLTPQESRELFKGLQSFVEQGMPVVLISHKLEEVREIAERITVLRQGCKIGTVSAEDTTPRELVRMMVGREISTRLKRETEAGNGEILKVEGLSLTGLQPLSFSLKRGEILAIAGVEGNGQEPLVNGLTGSMPARGKVSLDGKPIEGASVRRRRESGLNWVPSDRQQEGLVLSMSVAENLALREYYQPPFSYRGWLNLKSIARMALNAVRSFDVRPPLVGVPVHSLSGGNQQKVVAARELLANPKVLLASQPTRGLDIGAEEFVHRQLLRLRHQGCGILLVSSDLDEILELSDRIAILHRGKLMGVVERKNAVREEIGMLMMGRKPENRGS